MNEVIEILLIEDNPDDMELTLHSPRMGNLVNAVEVLRVGQEALDFLFARGNTATGHLENSPKLVLPDLKLPKVDGREVLRAAGGGRPEFLC